VAHTPRYAYTAVDLGTFGGPDTFQTPGRPLTNSGSAIATADTSTPDPYNPICFADCFVSPGLEWQHGQIHDLNTLVAPGTVARSPGSRKQADHDRPPRAARNAVTPETADSAARNRRPD
jgi:hypothetical protein